MAASAVPRVSEVVRAFRRVSRLRAADKSDLGMSSLRAPLWASLLLLDEEEDKTKKNLLAAAGDCVRLRTSSVAACAIAETRDHSSASIWPKHVATIRTQAWSESEAILVKARRASNVANLSTCSSVVRVFAGSELASWFGEGPPRREESGDMADWSGRALAFVLLKIREGFRGMSIRARAWLEARWMAEKRAASFSEVVRTLARRGIVSKSP